MSRSPAKAGDAKIARLAVKVSPKASRNAVTGWLGDVLKVSVTAAPERGKANQAVEELLAAALQVPRSAVAVIAGHARPRKLVEVRGIAADLLREKLAAR